MLTAVNFRLGQPSQKYATVECVLPDCLHLHLFKPAYLYMASIYKAQGGSSNPGCGLVRWAAEITFDWHNHDNARTFQANPCWKAIRGLSTRGWGVPSHTHTYLNRTSVTLHLEGSSQNRYGFPSGPGMGRVGNS